MNNRYSRRSFIGRLGLLGSMFPLASWAQQVPSAGMKRIGYLSGDAPGLLDAFNSELRRLGYIEGKNITVETRLLQPNQPDGAKYAAELVHMDLQLIVAGALPAALSIRKANPAMPMVIATCPGMISNGFAASLEHPGGNVTGMDELPPGVTAKRVTLLKTAVPTVSRIALLSTTPGHGGHELQLADAEKAAAELGVSVKPYRATSLAELETALAAIVNDGMNGLVNFQGGLSIANRKLIVEFAAKHALPAMYQATMFPEAGGLMAWAPNLLEQLAIAARYVDQILKGANPGDLPIRYPTRYYLTINASTAKGLGLVFPPTLLAEADRVIP
jgi:putative tryptophan/tyrosine transport system substrate-binding protein